MIVYVAGYPKSGTTWITRLLGDALGCRTGGSKPSEDRLEIASNTERNRRWDPVIRKGHFVLTDDPAYSPVPRPHMISWRGLQSHEHKVVFVVRDPRDIAVSGAHHWKVSLPEFVHDMVTGCNGVRSIGPWNWYVNMWIERYEKFGAIIVRYEDMLQGPVRLQNLLSDLNFDVATKKVQEAYERQKFENRVKDIQANGHSYARGKAFNLRFMRKGIAGDWHNHFAREEAFEAEAHFGDLLRHFNYESNPHWWKEVS